MVRQYKIHTNLDGNDDKVWDVTNGKVRLYQPSNLGIDVMNNLWSGDGIGIMGTRNISQPDITFTLLTLGNNLEENYRLMNEFVNDLLSVRYVTLEYQTELFQVFADIALSSVTKTEGYGHNGTFTEEITFNVVTKWYTYESLEFTQIENGEIIQGVSKVYGGSYDAIPENLQGNTDFNQAWSGWTVYGNLDDWELVKEGGDNVLHAKPSTATNQQVYANPHNIYVTAGETYTVSFDYRDVAFASEITIAQVRVTSTPTGLAGLESFNIRATKATNTWERKTYTFTVTQTGYLAFFFYNSSGTGSYEGFYKKVKVEKGAKSTPWIPNTIHTAGYRYIENTAYTYYGETDVQRLSRWEIDKPFFSFTAKLVPSEGIDSTKLIGLKFLNTNLNEYSAILFKEEDKPDYIMINTDVNDEFYLSTKDGVTSNAFPQLDMQRYRTRIFSEGQMQMQNLASVDIKVKRKADFM